MELFPETLLAFQRQQGISCDRYLMVVSEAFVCTPVFVRPSPSLSDYLGVARDAFGFLKSDYITLSGDIMEINDRERLSRSPI